VRCCFYFGCQLACYYYSQYLEREIGGHSFTFDLFKDGEGGVIFDVIFVKEDIHPVFEKDGEP